MRLTINGKQETVPEDATIVSILRDRDLVGTPCAVEVNEALVPRAKHEHHALREGDRLEIVTLVGGG